MAGKKASGSAKKLNGNESAAAKRAKLDKPNTIEVEFNLASWQAVTEESGAFKVIVQMRECTIGGYYSAMWCLLTVPGETTTLSEWAWVLPMGDQSTVPIPPHFVPVVERAIKSDSRLWALIESVR